jgi:hypothetical protein
VPQAVGPPVVSPLPPLLPEPQPLPESDAEPGFPAPLSAKPLRTPAPAVTKIRVAPEPVDGFEFERAAMWLTDADEAKPDGAAPDSPAAVVAGKPVRPPKIEKRVLSWLDEDDDER